MEKSPKTVIKSLVVCDIGDEFQRIVEIIDFALKCSLKEIKIYFVEKTRSEKKFDYDFLEKLLAFLYNFVLIEKKEDFLFKTGIFFPFLFETPLETLLENQAFDAVFLHNHLDFNHPKAIKLNSESDQLSTPALEIIKEFTALRSSSTSNPKYKLFGLKTLAIGGTFDYLHSGHKLFLSCSALLASKFSSILTLGLTGEALLLKKQGLELIQPFSLRKSHLLSFLQEFHPFLGFNIVELQEPCGPTKTDPFEGLIVTKETISGAEYINKIRREAGLEALEVFVTGLVQQGKSIDQKLSSGEIRKELIKRGGSSEFFGFLKKTWKEEFDKTGFPTKLGEYWLDRLMMCYLEKWRTYHTLQHIYEMVSLFEKFKAEIKEKFRVFLCIWFHDAVYFPGNDRNEEDSIGLFQEFWKDYMRASGSQNQAALEFDGETIASYILCTKNHFEPIPLKFANDSDLLTFLDFDLAILASSKERYQSYCDGVYKEYQAVPNLYLKRRDFLKSILTHPSIFRSLVLRSELEEKARSNIEAEIKDLESRI